MSSLWEQQLENWIRKACRAEVAYRKPGNVWAGASFCDADVDDFVRSADAVALPLSRCRRAGVGQSILMSIQRTRQAVQHNTNLGIVLLLAPLASVSRNVSLECGIEDVLRRLSVTDAVLTYRAISVARPAGMGKAVRQDVDTVPDATLRECMQLAADRDLIAAQYANGFQHVLKYALPWLLQTAAWLDHHEDRLAWLALRLMGAFGDSLIRRKCGVEQEARVRQQAQQVLQAGFPFEAESHDAFERFDRFLRTDGHRRNPGTTADLIAATLFAGQREGCCTVDSSDTLRFR